MMKYIKVKTASKSKAASKTKRKAKAAPLKFMLMIAQGEEHSLNVSIDDGRVTSAFSGDIGAINDMVGGIVRGFRNVMEVDRHEVPQLAAQQAPGQVPVMTETEKAWNALTPEQQAAEHAAAPRGIQAVVASLRSIQTKRYANVAEYQSLVEYLLQEMPETLRSAVVTLNSPSIFGQLTSAATDEERAWLTAPEVAEWLGQYLIQLKPSVEAYAELKGKTQPTATANVAPIPKPKAARKRRARAAIKAAVKAATSVAKDT